MQGNNQCFLPARGSLARARQVSPGWQEPVPASPSHLHRQICLLGRAGAGWMCPSCAWGGMGMPKPPLKVQPAAAAQPSLVHGADRWQWHSCGNSPAPARVKNFNFWLRLGSWHRSPQGKLRSTPLCDPGMLLSPVPRVSLPVPDPNPRSALLVVASSAQGYFPRLPVSGTPFPAFPGARGPATPGDSQAG